MIELEFNPQVGEQVIGPPSATPYEVVDRSTNFAGEVLLKLKRLKGGSLFENVPLVFLQYAPRETVMHALHQLLQEDIGFPEDFQEGRFEAVSDEMYDGTPRVAVYFYLKPEVVASPEKARVWNDFYRRLHREIDPLLDDPQSPIWLQFMTREERSPVRAAS
jgi:hypothetical protein